jgi:glycosyltransferase involved in cell wall biosynthesis
MKFDLQKVTGVISMTSQLAQKLAPERPNLIIPTIQNLRMSLPLRNSTKSKKNTFNILYCGGLFHKYGVDLLLDAFIQADRPNWQLFITGKGDLETKIRNIAERNSQIQYFGFINIEKLVELYQIADVFVNPRLTTTPFSNLSFPSKVVEYLGTGKPVISTNLQIFDEKLKQHLIIARTDKPEELIRCFNEVASRDDQQREAWRLETIEFLANELSPVIQGRRIREFVASLTILN